MLQVSLIDLCHYHSGGTAGGVTGVSLNSIRLKAKKHRSHLRSEVFFTGKN